MESPGGRGDSSLSLYGSTVLLNITLRGFSENPALPVPTHARRRIFSKVFPQHAHPPALTQMPRHRVVEHTARFPRTASSTCKGPPALSQTYLDLGTNAEIPDFETRIPKSRLSEAHFSNRAFPGSWQFSETHCRISKPRFGSENFAIDSGLMVCAQNSGTYIFLFRNTEISLRAVGSSGLFPGFR